MRLTLAKVARVICVIAAPLAIVYVAHAQMQDSDTTADHSKFEAHEGPFETGPDVTEACLSCDTEAAKQVQKSIHLTWE